MHRYEPQLTSRQLRHVRGTSRIVILALVAVACDSPPPAPVPPPPSISVTVDRTNHEVTWAQRLGTHEFQLRVQRSDGFTAPVSLAVTGVPPVMSATVTPSVVPGNQDAATLRLQGVSLGPVAAGLWRVTVTATAPGVPNAAVVVGINIAGPPQFRVRAPESMTVLQGGSSTTRIRIDREYYSGSVDLEVSAPPEITARLVEDADGTDETDLVVDASAAARPGTAMMRLRARGTGDLADSVVVRDIPITVFTPAESMVAWTFCAGFPPEAVAIQQREQGPWVRVAPVGLTYTMSFPEGRGAIAVAYPTGTGDQALSYGSVIDLGREAPRCTTPSVVLMTLPLTGVTGADSLEVSHGEQTSLLGSWRPLSPNHQIQVPTSTFDLLVTNRRSGCGDADPRDRYLLSRNIPSVGGGILPAVQWSSAPVLQPGRRRVTLDGTPGSQVDIATTLRTAAGTTAMLGTTSTTAASATTCVLPPSLRHPGDVYSVSATSRDRREVRTITTDPGDLQLAFGPPAPTFTHFSPGRVAFRNRPEYADRLDFTWGNNLEGLVTVTFHRGYGHGFDVDYAFPLPLTQPPWPARGPATPPIVRLEGWTGPVTSSGSAPPGSIIRGVVVMSP